MTDPSAPPGPAPVRKGLPTGLKVLFGCLGVVALGLIVLVVAVGVGGFALKRGIESTVGSVGEHREASEALARLEREHSFQVPADGEVTEAQLQRFLAVTERAWGEMRPWAEEVVELRERAEARDGAGLREGLDGARALGGMVRSRIALARALEAEDMSLGEYAWTGLTLQRAAETSASGRASGVPAANRRLVARYETSLPDFDGQEPGPETVLGVAVLWGLAEAPTWRGLGLDTLARP